MAQLIPNSFSTFSLSADEEESGQVLNLNQKMVLQNKHAAIATQKLNQVFNPADVTDFGIQTAYLQAQLDLINWLLETSSEVEEQIKSRNTTSQS